MALTEKQLQVLEHLAKGLHPIEAAEVLGIKPSTISPHTNAIYSECRNAWDVPDHEQINYRFVQVKFTE